MNFIEKRILFIARCYKTENIFTKRKLKQLTMRYF